MEEALPVQQDAAPVTGYKDDDLVYVDPKLRLVVGLVEFSNAGRPKPLAMKETVMEEPEEAAAPAAAAPKDGKPGKPPIRRGRPQHRTRYYPWGTYRSMKRVYKIEGKQPRVESTYTLDQVIEKALAEPFWD